MSAREVLAGRWRRRFTALLATVVLGVAASAWATTAEELAIPASERSVKAAFVYKFPSYVEWPATAFPAPDTPLTIGVAGADDVLAELSAIATRRTHNDRAIAVRRVADGDSLAGMHLLFIGRSEPTARIRELAQRAQRRGVLTVTEVQDGLDHGATINFLVLDGRVRFEVALDNAERAGLKLSSRLLGVAFLVRMP